MNRHPTFTDKDRPVNLICDGRWHYASIMQAGQPSVLVPDGTYIVLYALHGQVKKEPASDLEVRPQRYPSKDSTAWTKVSLARRVDPDTFFGTFQAKMVVKGGSDSQEVGFDYRVRGGALVLEHRILKFLRQAD